MTRLIPLEDGERLGLEVLHVDRDLRSPDCRDRHFPDNVPQVTLFDGGRGLEAAVRTGQTGVDLKREKVRVL